MIRSAFLTLPGCIALNPIWNLRLRSGSTRGTSAATVDVLLPDGGRVRPRFRAVVTRALQTTSPPGSRIATRHVPSAPRISTANRSPPPAHDPRQRWRTRFRFSFASCAVMAPSTLSSSNTNAGFSDATAPAPARAPSPAVPPPAGLDQHDRVVGVERLAVPGTLTAELHDLFGQELAIVPLAGALDLHALLLVLGSFCFSVTSSSRRSPSSNGSTGFTNHASAPTTWRARRRACAPGGSRSRRCRGRGVAEGSSEAERPARVAISSATITSGRSRNAALAPSSPSSGAEAQLLPDPAFDAAHDQRHLLARIRVLRDQQHVHRRDATPFRAARGL